MAISLIPAASAINGTLPVVNGGTGTTTLGPAFSAYRGTSDQSFSQNTWTKVQFQAETFDTNSCYDSSTNYRFTPTVAGYYNLATVLSLGGTAYNFYIQIYKNGTGTGQYVHYDLGSGNFLTFGGGPSVVIYANGTTDYFEIYVYSNASSPIVNAGTNGPSWFTGFLARAA